MTEAAGRCAGGTSGASAGALLRAARERQGLHIAALAAAIKVPQRKLEALEADRYDELPDATFTRALAQTVCRALKIDAAPVLALLPQLGGNGLAAVAGGLNAPFRDRPGRAEPGRFQPDCATRCPGPRWRCWWRPRRCSCCRRAGGTRSGRQRAVRQRRRRRPASAADARRHRCRAAPASARVARRVGQRRRPCRRCAGRAAASAPAVEVVHSVPGAEAGASAVG